MIQRIEEHARLGWQLHLPADFLTEADRRGDDGHALAPHGRGHRHANKQRDDRHHKQYERTQTVVLLHRSDLLEKGGVGLLNDLATEWGKFSGLPVELRKHALAAGAALAAADSLGESLAGLANIARADGEDQVSGLRQPRHMLNDGSFVGDERDWLAV